MTSMMKTIGTFGKITGEVQCGEVSAIFTSDKRGETLSLQFEEGCQISVAFEMIEEIIRSVKKQLLLGLPKSKEYMEQEACVPGFYMSGKGFQMRKGEAYLFFRSDGKNEMLSIAFEEKGEISISYAAIESLIHHVREANK